MHARVIHEWDALASPLPGDVYLFPTPWTPPDPDVAPPLDTDRLPALRRGRPVQVFRIGQLFDSDGEPVIDITDELLSDIARVFRVTRDATVVPIDWNHGSAFGLTPAEGGSLGRVVDLVHVVGRGLWAVPEYTERGAQLVEESQGVLYTSPEFRVGPVFDRSTGEQIGGAEMLALALTNRPRQDRLAPVLLSQQSPPPALLFSRADTPESPAPRRKEEGMSDQKPDTQAPANPPAEGEEQRTDPRVEAAAEERAERREDAEKAREPEGGDGAQVVSLEEYRALKAEVDRLRKELEEARKGQEQKAAALSQQSREHQALSERLSRVEAELKAERKRAAEAEKNRLLDGLVARGVIRDARRSYFSRLHDTDRSLFDEEIARLEKEPEVPNLSRRLSSGSPGPQAGAKSSRDALHEQVVALCKSQGRDPDNPSHYLTAYRELSRGGRHQEVN